jgi:hypothetical protein
MNTARINRVNAAIMMFGKGSPQHKAAIKRFGKSGGALSPVVNLVDDFDLAAQPTV